MALVKVTDKEKNQKELEIKIAQAAFEEAVTKVYRKEAPKITIPGFRKGKAPRSIIEKMYGKGVFYEDAVNDLLPGEYEAAVKEAGIEPVSRPEIDVKSFEGDVVVTATVYVKPEVTLGEYKGLEAVKSVRKVTDDEVGEAIDRTRNNNAREIDVNDRPTQKDDTVKFDFDGSTDEDGVHFDGGKAENYTLKIGSGSFIPGFEDQMIGKNIGEDFDVHVTFPEDYSEKSLAGKAATFACRINSISYQELPAADDEFAKDVSEFNTFEEYKADVKAKLMENADKAAENALTEELVKKATENATVDIPECMIDSEVDAYIDNTDARMRSQGLSLEMYLGYMKQSIEDYKKEYRPTAERHVRTRLVLEKIAETEKVEVTEDEVKEEVDKLAGMYGLTAEAVKAQLSENSLKKDLAVDKAVKIIRDSANVKKETKKAETAKKEPAKKSETAKKPETAKKSETAKKTGAAKKKAAE